MKGAVISSEATPDKNKLSTDTLTYSDIQNKAQYSASSQGVNYAAGKGVEKKDQGLTPNIGVTVSGNSDSTTKSAISPGTIEVRSNPNQDLSGLSRDSAGALNALGKIFDKKSVQEKQELANLFGEVAYQAAGKLIEKQFLAALSSGDEETAKKWMPGGAYQIAFHAALGGIMADLGGSSFASGAAGAALDGIVQANIGKVSPDARQWISAIVGSAAGELVGGSAQTGASTAISAIRNNDFNDKLSGAWNALKDKGTGTLDGIKQLVTNPSVFFDAIKAVCQDPTLIVDSFVGDIPENYYKLQEAVANGDDYEAGYYATALLYDVALDAAQIAGTVKATSSLSRLVRISKAEAAGNIEQAASNVVQKMRELPIKEWGYDCSEIAEDLYNAAGGKGEILNITSNSEGQISVVQFGQKIKFDYHQVYSDGKYVYDPRYYNNPILKDDYFEMLNNLNPGNISIDVIK